MRQRFGPTAVEPAAPLWWGGIGLRVVTWLFALGAVVVHDRDYARPALAWVVLGCMAVWTVLTGLVYSREALRWRWRWFVVLDVVVVCGLMLTSPLILSPEQLANVDPLITTVWVAGVPVVAGTRFGGYGGMAAGLVVGAATAVARQAFTLDVARDGVLLVATGLLIGMSATTARKSAAALAEAWRKEAATAERERLARSIHDNVLQVLARVRRRGAEVGGEAAELAELAGEQEIALRALVTTEPSTTGAGETDLRAALQLLASSKVQVAAPADDVLLPARVTAELVAVVREALSNTAKHAPGAKAWVLLENLADEVVVTVRDDGPGIPEGRLAEAEARGQLGVARSMKGRVLELGGSISLETAPERGTEWEVRVPKAGRKR
ncbi:MacS family sensor histidine kinase [Amycolatopsis sacchari]|uniref:MacS family sensor histidine kinase n=1 Tax=Amycolatopsis sacchari TaxID=115433 RepID=UPI003D747E1C